MTDSTSLNLWSFDRIYPLIVRLGVLLLGLLMLVSLVLYGISVILENNVVALGKKTRNLHEDNQDLQIKLDRLRSYEKVAAASEKIHGLKVATSVIDVMEGPPLDLLEKKPPSPVVPSDVYGY